MERGVLVTLAVGVAPAVGVFVRVGVRKVGVSIAAKVRVSVGVSGRFVGVGGGSVAVSVRVSVGDIVGVSIGESVGVAVGSQDVTISSRTNRSNRARIFWGHSFGEDFTTFAANYTTTEHKAKEPTISRRSSTLCSRGPDSPPGSISCRLQGLHATHDTQSSFCR